MIKLLKTVPCLLLIMLYLYCDLSANDLTWQYIEQYKTIAIKEMQRVGIPASIKMAQAIVESNSGTSTLAQQSNNHFGIKCGNNWSGPQVYREDDDYENGLLIKSCFRAFNDPVESFMEHSDFLANPNSLRYQPLFQLDVYDYQAWAVGLKRAGYATDPSYAEKLINIIEKYRLYELDLGIISREEYVQAHHSSTEKSDEPNVIASTYTKSKRNSDDHSRSVKRKNNKPVFHRVGKDESMASIAEKYGIDTKTLYFRNRMPFGTEPVKGSRLAIDHYIHFGDIPEWTKESNDENGVVFDQQITLASR